MKFQLPRLWSPQLLGKDSRLAALEELDVSLSQLPLPSPKRPVNPTPIKAKQRVPPIPQNSLEDNTYPPTDATLQVGYIKVGTHNIKWNFYF